MHGPKLFQGVVYLTSYSVQTFCALQNNLQFFFKLAKETYLLTLTLFKNCLRYTVHYSVS